MASKSKTMYVCTQCSYESAKWYGQCPGCGEWNTMEETVVNPISSKKKFCIARSRQGGNY